MSASRNGGQPSFSLHGDFSDGDMLAVIDDLADENGWTTTYDIRMQLGEQAPEKLLNVGKRLAWMRTYGWLEKGDVVRVESWVHRGWERVHTWRLTAMGQALVDDPKLSRSLENALTKLGPAQRLQLTRELGEDADHAPDEIRTALRRQWQRSMGIGRKR